MRVNTDLRSDVCLDPIISIQVFDRCPLTLEVICLHGPVIYQQGREIGVAITHTGAPPGVHRFDAMRIKVGGIKKVD